MGQLPSARKIPSRAFSKSGVDYCGPFYVRPLSLRGPSVKIFVCMASKAVHIEMVYGVVHKRIETLRFASWSRFGHKQRFDEICSSNSISNGCTENGIQFHFNPARSPHCGGLCGAAVKIFKHHLYRIMRETHLSIDDFHTLITQIEGIMNCHDFVIRSSRCHCLNASAFSSGRADTLNC
ncbi:uncharacterized protein LOC131696356 [Topomyia yanbarensis]|uniref:uncharacterized protein LOC131696356 n=1 Tax=Topomyia yanbarensis TaxID=2498891 RepID=UPI00273B4D67|nr:uncharacterized protein LOC131696356 [Topomyia yanbarensis]